MRERMMRIPREARKGYNLLDRNYGSMHANMYGLGIAHPEFLSHVCLQRISRAGKLSPLFMHKFPGSLAAGTRVMWYDTLSV